MKPRCTPKSFPTLSLLALVLTGCLSNGRFSDRPIVWSVDDTHDIAEPEELPFDRYTTLADAFVMRRTTRLLEIHDREPAHNTNALDEVPDSDLALYLIAAVEARRGAHHEALELLGRAIEISPDARAQARYDPDFEGLRHDERFRALTDVQPGPGAARRVRRTRAER